MSDKPQNPLSQSDIDLLKSLPRKIATAKKHIELAKQAGIELPDAEKILSEMEDKQKRLILVYGNPSNFA